MAASALGALRHFFRAKRVAGKYTDLQLDDDAIRREDYKLHIGAGTETWHSRGLFQLDFLRKRGLEPWSRLLDIGCGPLRAGLHFIRYLDTGNYCGFDYNESFVAAGRQLIAEHDLSFKHASISVLADFRVEAIGREFDYAIAFSVLNHCDDAQRRLFFLNIGQCLAPGAKLFISHAHWLKEADITRAGLTVQHRFEGFDLNLESYGWPPFEQRSVYPIYELRKLRS
jgi:SAM-dependent methyltransferase